jgi:hypothetical protein
LDKIINSGKGCNYGRQYKYIGERIRLQTAIRHGKCLTITIKEATRATDSSATEIVQIMTNLPGYQYKVGVKHSVLSDHYVQEMEVFMNIRTGISYKEVRDVLDDNIMELCTLLKNEVWEDIIGETVVNKIRDKLYATFN